MRVRAILLVALMLAVSDGLRIPILRATAVSRSHVTMGIFDDLASGFAKLQAGGYDEAEIQARMAQQVRTKPCIVYSMSNCPYCEKVKSMLTNLGAVYTCLELDEEEDGMAMKAELPKIAEGRSSVPAVFVGGKFVGGANDGGLGGALTLHDTKELDQMLMAAGSLTATQRI